MKKKIKFNPNAALKRLQEIFPQDEDDSKESLTEHTEKKLLKGIERALQNTSAIAPESKAKGSSKNKGKKGKATKASREEESKEEDKGILDLSDDVENEDVEEREEREEQEEREEEQHEEEENGEENAAVEKGKMSKRGKKDRGEMSKRVESGVVGEQPSPLRDDATAAKAYKTARNSRVETVHIKSVLPDVISQEELDDLFDKMPNDRKKITKSVMSYLDRLQYLALARAEKKLISNDEKLSPTELIKLSQALKEMQLTIKWTKKLEQAILDNPSKLIPPGSRSFTLLSKVKELASSTKREMTRDGRQSGIKNANNVMIAREINLPKDDDMPGGAASSAGA